jgi:hypothetical protein
LRIPPDCWLEIDNESDRLLLNLFGEVRNMSLPGDVKNHLELRSGDYELVIYYDDLDWGEIKNYTLVFR